MEIKRLDIPKADISATTDLCATISVDGDVLFTLTLKKESDGSLYYHLFDEADLDGAFVIEGHLPEYFDNEYCGHIYESYCDKCGVDSGE